MIGSLLSATGGDWLVGVVSDHGAGDPPEREFPVHAWLAGRGWLAERRSGRAIRTRAGVRLLRRGVPRPLRPLAWRLLPSRLRGRVEVLDMRSRLPDWSATPAYFVGLGYPFGAISINLRGREPFGIVEPGREYERLRDEIVAELPRAVDPATGERPVAGVWRREELYAGAHLADAPDVIFETAPRYRSRGGAGVEWDTPMELAHGRISGDHRADGMLVLAGGDVFRAGATIQGARIVDVAPTLLHAMGAPVPLGLDGRVLEEAFVPGFLQTHPPRFSEALPPREGPSAPYSREEEAQVHEALRRIGYVE
jgi:predicted AlkP superfamily phosphohydrolase/phosphomutase